MESKLSSAMCAGELLLNLECFEPEIMLPVLVDLNFLRARSSRCNLYSTGPSCGSAFNRVTLLPLCAPSLRDNAAMFKSVLLMSSASCSSPTGVPAPCSHGEWTLGGSGSHVKIDAILILSSSDAGYVAAYYEGDQTSRLRFEMISRSLQIRSCNHVP